MIELRTQMNQRLIDLTKSWVGPGSDNSRFIRTFDDHLRDAPYDEMPFLVVNVRDFNEDNPPEIGTPFADLAWDVHIYYLDVTDDYSTGDQRRNTILGKLTKNIQKDPRLGNLSVEDEDGARAYVWNSRITSGNFDYTGQDEYHSFVSELYLIINTAS